MLFPYKYISHPVEKLQEYIDFLFLEVWCKAEGDFDIEKLDGCPELKELTLKIYYDDRTTDYLYGPAENIFNMFKALGDKKRRTLAKWYIVNNSIEHLCCNRPGFRGKRYKDLQRIHNKLSSVLEDFFKALFTNVIHLQAVKERTGDINKHYTDFMITNEEEVCPFCGLNDLKGPYLSKRDAYDHYLPKDTYPFNSINFKNLAPMCHECNTSYKLRQDPLYKPPHRDPLHSKEGHKRRAFYPYLEKSIDITIKMSLRTRDIHHLTPDEIELNFLVSPDFKEEVATWVKLFGIEERFKEKCCKKNDGKYWFVQIADEFTNARTDGVKALQKIYRKARKFPYAERNFLKKAFLEACEQAGVFEEHRST